MNNIEAVELFINNAGIMYVGMTEAYSIEQASEQMNTNYFF
jgi:short-subunit dehydrogenase